MILANSAYGLGRLLSSPRVSQDYYFELRRNTFYSLATDLSTGTAEQPSSEQAQGTETVRLRKPGQKD